jgi:hypothetical protein
MIYDRSLRNFNYGRFSWNISRTNLIAFILFLEVMRKQGFFDFNFCVLRAVKFAPATITPERTEPARAGVPALLFPVSAKSQRGLVTGGALKVGKQISSQ